MRTPRLIQITVSCPSKREASSLGRTLVRERLAACAQVGGPIESVYCWKGKEERSKEWLVSLKTRKNLFHAAEKRIRALHSYEVPEVIACDVTECSPEYRSWVAHQCKK